MMNTGSFSAACQCSNAINRATLFPGRSLAMGELIQLEVCRVLAPGDNPCEGLLYVMHWRDPSGQVGAWCRRNHAEVPSLGGTLVL